MKCSRCATVALVVIAIGAGFEAGRRMTAAVSTDPETGHVSLSSPDAAGWQFTDGDGSGPPAGAGFAQASDPGLTRPADSAGAVSFPHDVAWFPEVLEAPPAMPAAGTSQQVPADELAIWQTELAHLPPDQAEEILKLRNRFGPVLPTPDYASTAGHASPPRLLNLPSADDSRPAVITQVAAGAPPDGEQIPETPLPRRYPEIQRLLDEARAILRENLANQQTPGYVRRELIILSITPAPPSEGSSTQARGTSAEPPVADPASPPGIHWMTRLDLTPGKSRFTSHPLDVEILGAGWFKVDSPAGPAYTRCGLLAIDDQARMCVRTASGLLPLLPEVRLPEPGSRCFIFPTGAVHSTPRDSEPVAHLTLWEFPDASALRRSTAGLLVPTEESGNPTEVIRSTDTLLNGQTLLESNVSAEREHAAFQHLESTIRILSEQKSPASGDLDRLR